MLVRNATVLDSPRIAALHVASWRFAYRDALSDEYLAGDVESDRRQLWDSRLANPAPNQHILLMEDGPQLVGFSCVYVDEDPEFGSYLNNIHVAQSQQGKGIGGRLLRATALVADDAKATCTTEVLRSRYYAITVERLLELLEVAGFVGVERRDDVLFQPVFFGRKPSA